MSIPIKGPPPSRYPTKCGFCGNLIEKKAWEVAMYNVPCRECGKRDFWIRNPKYRSHPGDSKLPPAPKKKAGTRRE